MAPTPFFSFGALPLQVWIYFPPETREPSPRFYCLSLIEAQTSGPSHLDQMWNHTGGSFNFQPYRIEPPLCCESMQRVNSTLNRLELVLQHRIHINNTGAVRHSGIFVFFLIYLFFFCLTIKVSAFFSAFPHLADQKCALSSSCSFQLEQQINSHFNWAPCKLRHHIISEGMLNKRKKKKKGSQTSLFRSAIQCINRH